MNRAQRRAQAARDRAAKVRHAAIEDAMAYMATADDPTISGATLFLPSGETLYLSADTARAMAAGKPASTSGGQA